MSLQHRVGAGRSVVLAFTVAIVSLASACTWVKLTPEAERVRLADVSAVSECEKLGKVHTTTRQKVGLFSRSQAKVQKELATLARNDAARMGGDTVAGVTEVRDGGRTFDIYRCKGEAG